MGEGKGVGGVVDQLAHRIVIPEAVLFLPLQTAGDPCHKVTGIVIVMSPEPLAAERSLKIGHGVPIRLDAADQERFLVTLRQAVHVMLSEVMAETQMAFSAHKKFSLNFFSLIIPCFSREFVNKPKDW